MSRDDTDDEAEGFSESDGSTPTASEEWVKAQCGSPKPSAIHFELTDWEQGSYRRYSAFSGLAAARSI